MHSRWIVPTCIAIGCMGEAVVSSGYSEAGPGQVHLLAEDVQPLLMLHVLGRCSVLKGVTHREPVCACGPVEELLRCGACA